MRPASLLAAFTVALMGGQAVTPPDVQAQAAEAVQWRIMSARRCARADSLFGRYWRSHASIIRVFYSQRRDTTTIRTPDRGLMWEPGSTRLVRVETAIRIPGRMQTVDSAQIELSLSFADSLYRTPEQAALDLVIDDTVHLRIQEPQVDYPIAVSRRGIPLVVTALLTKEQSLVLARARWLTGTMGPLPFSFKDWELWEINAIYRASFCGIE
jgi:hypothetical protein